MGDDVKPETLDKILNELFEEVEPTPHKTIFNNLFPSGLESLSKNFAYTVLTEAFSRGEIDINAYNLLKINLEAHYSAQTFFDGFESFQG